MKVNHRKGDARDALRARFHAGIARRQKRIDDAYAEVEAAQLIYNMRTAAGLSQRDLAKLVGTSASAICRLEDADYGGHTLSTLNRIASALGKRIEIRVVNSAA